MRRLARGIIFGFLMLSSGVAVANYIIPVLFCAQSYVFLAKYWDVYFDPNLLTAFYRIAIWEPDLSNDCDWKIGYSLNTIGAPVMLGVDYTLNSEWARYIDPSSIYGVQFALDYYDYFLGRGEDSGVQQIQIDLIDHDNIPSNWYNAQGVLVVYGYTNNSKYENDAYGIFRMDYALCTVLSDGPAYYPPYYENTFQHTSTDVLRHEIGHALLFGAEVSDGMFAPVGLRTRYLSANELTMLQCCYNPLFVETCDQNVATKISNFWISDQLTATWDAACEIGIGYYRIEGLEGDTWLSVADSVAAGYGNYVVQLEGPPLSRYRLIERSQYVDDVLCYGSPGERDQIVGGATIDVDLLLEEAKAEYFASNNAVEELGLRSAAKMLVIGPEALLDEVALHGDPLWRDIWGCSAHYVYTDSIPGSGEDLLLGIKAVIEAEYDDGVRYVLLVGAANDYVQWQSDWWTDYWWEDIRESYLASGFPLAGIPENNIVPTWFYRDSGQPNICMSRSTTPYWYSDIGYSLMDSDGIPDLVVTRWPAVTTTDIKSLMTKLYSYSLGEIWDQGVDSRMSFFVGDLAYRTFIDDSIGILRAAVETKNLIPAEVLNWSVYMSDSPDLSNRNEDFAYALNSVHPNLVLVYSNGSNTFSLGGFLDYESWDMSHLDPGVSSVYLAASCMTADYARTTAGEIHGGTFGQFLLNPNKGAYFWIGPSNATWQTGNEVMLKGLASEFYNGNSEPMAEKFFLSQSGLLGDAGLSVAQHAVVRSYGFFGDPLSPFRGGGDSPVAVPEVGQALPLRVHTYPNPFNPRIMLSLSLSHSGQWSIRIMDIRGQHVKTVFAGEKEKGDYLVEWDGTNHAGQGVSSGQYLVEIVGPADRIVRKVTLIR